jgi:hypothetical protein
MGRQRQRTKRRSRRSERTRRIAAVVAVTVLLAAGFFAATETKIQLSAAKPAPMPSDDEIYTGSILFVPDDGRVCRRFLFDNRTGRLSDSGLVDCESAYFRAPGTPSPSVARTQAISETFRHR